MCERKSTCRRTYASLIVTLALVAIAAQGYGQDGKAGIDKANEMVRGYFTNGTNLMYGIGAIIGIIGAVKVYQKWSAGDNDVNKVAAAWFGSCVFLVIVATVLKSFFGIA
ncbi:hypothetical protein J2T02_002589 [Chitinophaga terrae (ex Kim and Jung 2007)]|uniref:DUF4134 domain-containing protein n=1 Tax=Chitinophaga terrae (ex Kim and Jung 2007) TaxID=408074 RepID=UPI002785D9E3|nr:DUF4134 domain-containing protein [Chitinophaga terrae (ex Kim and Jung 2007)]MDQ0107470.1 hypothetical protein [Chitinophaga terrae (ex Kim and Jung 2007)]